MAEMTIKEWAAAYRADNEAEREELKARLATETVEQSIRSYFTMCQLATSLAKSTDVPVELQEKREKHYLELAEKWKQLAERLKYVQ